MMSKTEIQYATELLRRAAPHVRQPIDDPGLMRELDIFLLGQDQRKSIEQRVLSGGGGSGGSGRLGTGGTGGTGGGGGATTVRASPPARLIETACVEIADAIEADLGDRDGLAWTGMSDDVLTEIRTAHRAIIARGISDLFTETGW